MPIEASSYYYCNTRLLGWLGGVDTNSVVMQCNNYLCKCTKSTDLKRRIITYTQQSTKQLLLSSISYTTLSGAKLFLNEKDLNQMLQRKKYRHRQTLFLFIRHLILLRHEKRPKYLVKYPYDYNTYLLLQCFSTI